MYNNQLAVAIKAAGKVLREQKDKVFLPFGSEYSIFIKNLNTVRAAVRIEIDGVDVSDGLDLVVQPNSSIDIERFIKNGNMSEGNRFKFIERTSKIEQHRGVGVEDGLVRVEFQFEKVQPKVIEHDIHHYNHHYHDYWHYPYYPYYWCNPPYYNSGIASSCSNNVPLGGGGTSGRLHANGLVGSAQSDFTNYSADVSSKGASDGLMRSLLSLNASGESQSIASANAFYTNTKSAPNDAGITVPGSVSNQQFSRVSGFTVESEKHVIVLKLLGKTDSGIAVAEPVTVKKKQTCPTCGTRNRGANKFCRECGTSLEIV